MYGKSLLQRLSMYCYVCCIYQPTLYIAPAHRAHTSTRHAEAWWHRSGWRRLLEERPSTSRAAQFTGPFAFASTSRSSAKKMAQGLWRNDKRNCRREIEVAAAPLRDQRSVARWAQRYSRQRNKIFLSAFWSAELRRAVGRSVCQPSCCLGTTSNSCPSSTTDNNIVQATDDGPGR